MFLYLLFLQFILIKSDMVGWWVGDNLDNPEFTKKISSKVNNLQTNVDHLIKWYKEKSGKTTNNPASCQQDGDCNGGTHLSNKDQGGKCVNNKCKCNSGFTGPNCQNKAHNTQT